MKEIYMIAILYIAGIALSVHCALKKPQKRSAGIASSILFAVSSVFLIYCYFFKIDMTVITISFFSTGTLFLFGLSASTIITCKNCTHEVNATYLDSKRVTYKGSSTYYPRFFYVYEDKEYRQNSFAGYGRRTIDKLYKDYNSYTIFINPSKPYICVDKRAKPIGAVAVPFIAGLILLALPVYLALIIL